MDPYAAQWAHYGYAISAPADAGATAAYPAYYNYPATAAPQAGVQVTTAGNTAQAAVVKPQYQRPRYM